MFFPSTMSHPSQPPHWRRLPYKVRIRINSTTALSAVRTSLCRAVFQSENCFKSQSLALVKFRHNNIRLTQE